MEKLITLFVVLILNFICLWMSYRWGKDDGYNKREDEFQTNPITFNVGGEPQLWVGRGDGTIKVRYYKKDKVEFLGEE